MPNTAKIFANVCIENFASNLKAMQVRNNSNAARLISAQQQPCEHGNNAREPTAQEETPENLTHCIKARVSDRGSVNWRQIGQPTLATSTEL